MATEPLQEDHLVGIDGIETGVAHRRDAPLEERDDERLLLQELDRRASEK